MIRARGPPWGPSGATSDPASAGLWVSHLVVEGEDGAVRGAGAAEPSGLLGARPSPVASPFSVGVWPEELELLPLVVAELPGAAPATITLAADEPRGEVEAKVLDVVSQCAESTL